MNYANFPLDNRKGLPADEGQDSSDFIDIDRLLGMAARQAKVVAICAGIGLFLGVVYLQTTPVTYMAVTNVLFDEGLNKIVDEVSATPVNMQTDAAILSQIEIIKSARLASVVVEKEKLDQNQNFLQPPSSLLSKAIGAVRGVFRYLRPQRAAVPADAPELDEATRNAMAAAATKQYAALALQSRVFAQRVGRSYVIAIAYQSHDPVLAASITKAYADAYVADQLDASFEATERTAVWLQGRLAELRDSSQAAALAVEKFRAENGLTAAKGELIAEQQLSDLNSQLILARADTARALARYEQYKSIVESGSSDAFKNASISTDEAGNSVISTLKGRLLAVTKREQEISTRFGPDHAQAVMLRNELQGLSRQIFSELQQLTETYRNEYEVARSRETVLEQSVAQATGQNSEANQSQVQLRELEQQSTALSALYQTFLARYEEASQQRSFPIGKVRVISDATVPQAPSGPRSSMVFGLSLVLGVLMGAAFGVLNEFNERFFRTGEDVRDWLGVKFLGYLPLHGAVKTKLDRPTTESGSSSYLSGPSESESSQTKRARMRIAVDAPASMFAETLRNAKIACDVVLQGSSSRIIGVVSVLPGEGKSTVAANLAALLAANGAKTLLIDGDLRNPGLTRALGIKAKAGLVEAVVSEEPWQSVLKVERQTKLAIIPAVARRQFSHSSDLLSSAGMRHMLDEARQSFDYIIVDLPPIGPVVDAKAFAPLVDGFVLVAEWGRTPRALLRSILHSETLIAKKVLGLVLNKVELRKLAKYGSFGGSGKVLEQYSTYYNETPEFLAKTRLWRPDVRGLSANLRSAISRFRTYLRSITWSRFSQ